MREGGDRGPGQLRPVRVEMAARANTGRRHEVGRIHLYTHALLSAIPVPNPRVQRGRPRVMLVGEIPSPANPPSGCRFRTRCPRADALCADRMPELRPLGGGQFVACHHPLFDAGDSQNADRE